MLQSWKSQLQVLETEYSSSLCEIPYKALVIEAFLFKARALFLQYEKYAIILIFSNDNDNYFTMRKR